MLKSIAFKTFWCGGGYALQVFSFAFFERPLPNCPFLFAFSLYWQYHLTNRYCPACLNSPCCEHFKEELFSYYLKLGISIKVPCNILL